ncbi:MAG: hypothetical protein EZS28_055867, partial [Streblomastix strix]
GCGIYEAEGGDGALLIGSGDILPYAYYQFSYIGGGAPNWNPCVFECCYFDCESGGVIK